MTTPLRRIAASVVLSLVVILLGVGLRTSQSASQRDLEQRFANRADLSSRFARSYVADLVSRERAVATRRLGGTEVSSAEFARVVEDMGFGAAVLLDDRGRLLAVVPANPNILGKTIAPQYKHLTAAEAGRVGVSGVVPGAASGQPVVAFATPFDTPGGRRVFSGAFDVGSGPLGAYLANSLPYPGATSDIVDVTGKIVASSRHPTGAHVLSDADVALAAAFRPGDSAASFRDRNQQRRFVAASPSGTPWTLVNSVPEAALYSPLGGSGQLMPWVALAGLALAGIVVLMLVMRLSDSREAMTRMSLTDPLTGVANRRAWEIELAKELTRAQRFETPLSVAILDLDNFKEFNDHHGHQAGDQLLVAAARAWSDEVRDIDTVARYGGEEFAVLLPGTPRAAIESTLDRVRRATPAGCSASAGGAEWNGVETAVELVSRADSSLYEAKNAGRECTVVASSDRVLVSTRLHAEVARAGAWPPQTLGERELRPADLGSA